MLNLLKYLPICLISCWFLVALSESKDAKLATTTTKKPTTVPPAKGATTKVTNTKNTKTTTAAKNGTAVNGTQLLPMVINTWAFRKANAVAWRTLMRAPDGVNETLNAVVEGCTLCERMQCDGTVGYGGSPDELGETTLDAMIMDGKTMSIGAVAGLRRIKDAIRVASSVMQHTRHTLLVGDGATEFAKSMGFNEESLTTPDSRVMWEQWQAHNCQPNFWINVFPDPSLTCGPYTPEPTLISRWKEDRSRYEYSIGLGNHDTIGLIAIDAKGQIHAGTSTNGARHKLPGRVGDSPIPGAGAYADNEVGAAVATGDGDIMMRFLPSLLAVESMRAGKTPTEAATEAMKRIVRYYPDFSGGLVVVDKLGNYDAACVGMKSFPFTITNAGNATRRAKVEYRDCIKREESIELK